MQIADKKMIKKMQMTRAWTKPEHVSNFYTIKLRRADKLLSKEDYFYTIKLRRDY